MMLQMLYKITNDRMQSEREEGPASPNPSATAQIIMEDKNATVQEPEVNESIPEKAETIVGTN